MVRRIACCVLLVLTGVLLAAEAPSRKDLWSAVDKAVKDGLPKTAIEKLEPIIKGALEEKDYDEALKAIAKKIALEGEIQGNKPEEKITRLETELAKAPAEMKPLMESLLANWYWQYFRQNRWRFLNRTQTAAPPGEDFTTWALPRLFDEIDKHFQQALSAADMLKKTPIGQYDELLEKGNSPDTLRPTLYDFIAQDALDFYASAEQAAARPEDAFDLTADTPIFASMEEFLAWKPQTADEDSPTFKAVRLYQELIRFHQGDDDPAALLDADLQRLEFGFNKASGPEKNARYKAALERFADKHADHPISARALSDWASVLQSENDLVEARKIAKQGLARFADSVGGRRCYNLIHQIEAPTCQVTTERVWNAPLPTIDVRYRNVTKIYFHVVPFDFEQFTKSRRWSPENLNHEERKALLRDKPVLSWSADLPATDDYQFRVEELPAPKDLKRGSYYLISSHKEDFSEANNQVSFTEFWVSDLALVVRSRQGTDTVDGFVLEAGSGEPIQGATVRAWRRGNNNQLTPLESTKTDERGMFRFQAPNRTSVLLLATHQADSLSSANYFYINQYDTTPKPFERTFFFTDRGLYRPGQTIQYKGIVVAVNQQEDNYRTVAGRSVTVIFSDVNGKEIEHAEQRTNDYGSFGGSFTAPRDRLTGRMTIHVAGAPSGATQISVEEYKRPKFQTTLEAPTEAPRLGAEVTLEGKATAYTGAAIDGAKVRWRVVRRVRYPMWWYWRCWWMPPVQTQAQEIAHGTATTGVDGKFMIAFTARPDLSVDKESEPTFQFSVSADVTDTTGETRSAERTVNVGYTALAATLSADEWQADDQPVEITVKTTTLDGEAQSAKGKLQIYRLKQPDHVERGPLGGGNRYPVTVRRGKGAAAIEPPAPDPANPDSWEAGEVVFEKDVETDAGGMAKVSAKLAAGMFRAKLQTQDRFGKPVTAELPLRVLDPDANHLNLKIPNVVAAPKWTLEPGEELLVVWGSGYKDARAYVEVEHRGKLMQHFWTEEGVTQMAVKQTVDESMRGGFTVRITMVRENRAYLFARRVDVPWSNKNLAIKWEHFVSKLEPAQRETWTAVISGPDGKAAMAEMVAALYDASLDAYLPFNWTSSFGVFRQDHSNVYAQFENQVKNLQHIYYGWRVDQRDGTLTYRHWPGDILGAIFPRMYFGRNRAALGGLAPRAPAAAAPEEQLRGLQQDKRKAGAEIDGLAKNATRRQNGAADRAGGKQAGAPEPDLSKVSARKNLNETAFFFPRLLAGEDGTVKMEFTMPEALTEWKFLGFAHDTQLRSSLLTDKTVTAKDLMVQPNPPRFLREGDVVEFTVKVSNQSAARQEGAVRLALTDARTDLPVDSDYGNDDRDRRFDVPAGESRTFSWKLTVPDGAGVLAYKAVGSTGKLSDGEEGMLPVLSRRILVTESLALPIRGPATKKFDFTKLEQSGKSRTLQSKTLTVQMVSNPSWYAVMALPYLMEFPHECTEQTFNRLYANSLARHIAGSDPKIHRVFEQWRGTPALDSPLEKNQDLKAVMIEETPWLRQAQAESQARRNVGILFDDNRLNDETARLQHKLAEQQYDDGAWPWFPGGPANDYITLYITTGYGRLRHLGVKLDMAPAVKSLARLDSWADRMYREALKHKPDENHLTTLVAFYLYGRSFFLDDQKVADAHKDAVNYWLGQARKYWLRLACRQSEAHLALALKRFGDGQTPKKIMASIKEHSVTDEELGMFWRDTEFSWWWYRAPIETQAMMIEAFDEVMGDKQAVEECKVWLLKQKQTQDWKTTKATADAVYALLLRGTDQLASDELVQVSLGGQAIEPEAVEAGTGFFEKRFTGGDIKPKLGQVTVKKLDPGVAWGSLHWQYLEDMSKLTPYEGTPLTLQKSLYTKQYTAKGPVLEPVAGPVAVGDELVVRIVLRVDRDMEYVHLKDYRGSGTEPTSVLSKYKYQDGLAYYEATRDTASHFFIDYLPKGTYVFEYSTRVQLKGSYQTGIAQIQCMYAPEFNSHSESVMLKVQ